MTQFSAFGTHGNGTTGPGASTSFGAAFVSGLTFKVTQPGQFLYGYYYWRADSGQSASAQGALWTLTANATGTFQTGTSASTSSMAVGQWNFIALAVPFALTSGTVYRAVIGVTGNFNDVHSQFGTGGPYSAGIVNGPLTVYSAPTGQGGTNEAPFTNVFQGTFGTSGADPTANLPASDDSQANFFVDILVGPAAAPAVSGGPSQAVRAKRQLSYPRAGSVSAEIQPGTGNISGPLQGAGFGNGMGASGGPVRNPSPGPVFRSLHWPVQAQDPLGQRGVPNRRGRVYGISRGAPVSNPPPPQAGPPFRPLHWPVQAQDALGQQRVSGIPGPRGRIYGISKGAPVQNPPPVVAGPPVRPRSFVRGQVLPPSSANFFGRAATMAAFPAPPALGPVFRQSPHPARAVIPPVFSKGRTSGSRGAPLRNPLAGPFFRQFARPVQAAHPLPPKGRTASNSGAPVQNPAPTGIGPPFAPFRQAVHIRFALPPKGRAAGSQGGPVAGTGPAFAPFRQALRARLPLLPRGRSGGSQGGPVQNPPPPVLGPAFIPKGFPARTRPSLPSRGKAGGSQGAPPQNPLQGPAFRQQPHPAQARILQAWSKGRTSGNPGGPVANPPTRGPFFASLPHPVQARLPLPPRGRAGGSRGAPLITSGPVFRPAVQALRARQPLPGRGRASSNPGIPVVAPQVGAAFASRRDPARIRPSLPLRGRIWSGRGTPARNPSRGPGFTQAVRPIRAVIPRNAPRGRVYANSGGPVENIPLSNVLLRPGMLTDGWRLHDITASWEAGQLTADDGTGLLV